MTLKLGAKSGSKAGWWHFRDALAARESFSTSGALEGVNHEAWWTGQLPIKYSESAEEAQYVVYSYSTPIAWLDKNGVWQQPDIKYSVTTTAHQNKIATAISQIGR